MPPASPAAAATNPYDFSQVILIIANPDNLFMVFLIAVGYFARSISGFPNKFIPHLLLSIGIIFGVLFSGLHIWSQPTPILVGMIKGVVYAALSMIAYDFIISKIESKARQLFGLNPDPSADKPSTP